MIEEGAQRLGGAVTLETGEGRTNVPVGTIMAQIEIATQVMASIHRRNHRAQREELRKLRDLFVLFPADLTKLARDPKRNWETVSEFKDLNLVPASDPDIPGQVARIMQAWALMLVAQQNSQLYDMREVNDRVLQTIRVSSPESVLLTPDQLAARAAAAVPPAPPTDPTKLMAVQQRAQQQQDQNQQKIQETQLDMQDHAQERQDRAHTAALESADRAADRAAHAKSDQMKLELERERLAQSQNQAQLAREHDERLKAQPAVQPAQPALGMGQRPMTGFDYPA
jgi:hypothetical protein